MGFEKEKLKIDTFFDKISPKERIYSEIESSKIIDNVIGFIPACDSCDSSILITNLAVFIAKKGLNVCILDNKVFSPNIYMLLDCKAVNKGNGLIKALRSDRIDIKNELIETKYKNLYLLSPSPFDPIEDYFDFNLNDIERVMSSLKEMFDVILVDIPNNPPLEFFIGSIKYCNAAFFIWSERSDCPINTYRLVEYIKSLAINTQKIKNIIINNSHGFPFDKSVITEMGMKHIAEFPFIPNIVQLSLEGKVYIEDSFTHHKSYVKALKRLAEMITK